MNTEVTRRKFASLVGAAAAVSPFAVTSAGAVTIRHVQASLLPPSTHSIDAFYVPPQGIKASSDLFSRMTAPVLIDGKGPFPFVVDTGANQSVISAELVSELGLALGERGPLHGVAGVTNTDTVRIGSFRAGSLDSTDAKFSVLPQSAIGGAGFLGLDQIQQQCLTLDFKRRRILIEAVRSNRNPNDFVLPATYRAGQLTLVNGRVAGIPITAFMDSGAQTSIGNEKLRSAAASRFPDLRRTNVEILSATGQTISGNWAQLRGFNLGGMSLNYLPVVFADLHTFQIWKLTEQPAILIGVDIMSQFEYVALDFPRNEVRFHVPRAV